MEIVPFLLWLAFAIQAILGNRSLKRLERTPPWNGPAPRVSIIVPARNEERGIQKALQSLLALDYPAFEVIVVNDRSTDRTGEILRALSGIQLIEIAALPPGWLGKNHALDTAARRATGEWLLFTDADVVFSPTSLRRAMRIVLEAGLDHLACLPRILLPGAWLQSFVITFALFFSMYARPWKAADRASGAHAGIGAFNLVRASAYRAVGGHQAIRLRPDDDMMLAKLLKKGGAHADFANGFEHLSVEWYHSLKEMAAGLEKNLPAGVRYSWLFAILVTLAIAWISLWPFAAAATSPWAAATLLVILLISAFYAHSQRLPLWLGLFFPLNCILFLALLWRSMALAAMQGGIKWRGTLYGLGELRRNRV